MRGRYTLEWLDSLVNVSLNPNKTDIAAMTDAQVRSVISRIGREKDKQQAILKDHIFGSTKEKQIELLLKQYHSTLIVLLDQALENHKYVPDKRPGLLQLTNELIDCLDELLSFIELRFSSYLSLDERVPVSYMKAIKMEFKQRLERLKPKLEKASDDLLGKIILESLYALINRKKDDVPITFQEVFYKKDLLRELEELNVNDNGRIRKTDLNALLIYMNFNSRAYINYYAQRVTENINSYESLSDRMDRLLFHLKEFNQMRRKPGVILNPQYGDLKPELANWFNQEIFYLEKKMHFSLVPMNVKEEKANNIAIPNHKENQKVLCALSVDQLAIILKSADDLKVIISSSLNKVFKTIVPHLSTPHQQNLSPDSMRSKSYSPEERDKEIVVQTLEQMINKIREY